MRSHTHTILPPGFSPPFKKNDINCSINTCTQACSLYSHHDAATNFTPITNGTFFLPGHYQPPKKNRFCILMLLALLLAGSYSFFLYAFKQACPSNYGVLPCIHMLYGGSSANVGDGWGVHAGTNAGTDADRGRWTQPFIINLGLPKSGTSSLQLCT